MTEAEEKRPLESLPSEEETKPLESPSPEEENKPLESAPSEEEKKPEAASPAEKSAPERGDLQHETGFLRLTGYLCLLFALCGLVLGLTNLLTEERIARHQGERHMGLLEEVLPYGGNYEEIRYSGGDPAIEAVYAAEGAGWVFQVSPEGSYSGDLTLLVGINGDGTVSGVAVTSSGETEGLGLRASEKEFRDQFAGKSGYIRVGSGDGDITAISGATTTTRAVCAAVNSALKAAADLS